MTDVCGRRAPAISAAETCPAPRSADESVLVPSTSARTSLRNGASAVTSSRVALPLARRTPLPDNVTVRLELLMPVLETTPLPVRINASSDGTLTSTLIGLLVVKLPDLFPITSLPACTWVVTRRSRLSSACTTTDCSPPTRTTTLLLPANSTPLKRPSSRVCVAATPEP